MIREHNLYPACKTGQRVEHDSLDFFKGSNNSSTIRSFRLTFLNIFVKGRGGTRFQQFCPITIRLIISIRHAEISKAALVPILLTSNFASRNAN